MFSQRNNPYCDLLYFRSAKLLHFFHIQANKKIFIFVSYYKCLCLRMYVLKYFFTFFIYPIKYKAGKTKLSRCFWVFCGSFIPLFWYLIWFVYQSAVMWKYATVLQQRCNTIAYTMLLGPKNSHGFGLNCGGFLRGKHYL